jgi:hypothetical protein
VSRSPQNHHYVDGMLRRVCRRSGRSRRVSLVFHVGYGYSRLRDVEVEKVRSLSNRGLFSVVKDPGDRLLVGGSARAEKLSVTAGAMSGSVKKGVNPIVEAIGGQVGARELFGSVSTRRDWQPHVGLSFHVF